MSVNTDHCIDLFVILIAGALCWRDSLCLVSRLHNHSTVLVCASNLHVVRSHTEHRKLALAPVNKFHAAHRCTPVTCIRYLRKGYAILIYNTKSLRDKPSPRLFFVEGASKALLCEDVS